MKFSSFALCIVVLCGAVYPAVCLGDEGDPGTLARIDQDYRDRSRAGSIADGLKLCDLLIASGKTMDEAYWRIARFKAWEGAIAPEKEAKLALFNEAKESAEKGVRQNPDNVEAHFWKGVALGRIGETQGIFKSFFLIEPIRHEMDEVLSRNPNHGGAHHLLGVMYEKLPWFKGGSSAKSVEELQKSIALNPVNTLYHLDLAKTFFDMKKKDEARRELESVLKIEAPFDPVEAEIDRIAARRLLDEK